MDNNNNNLSAVAAAVGNLAVSSSSAATAANNDNGSERGNNEGEMASSTTTNNEEEMGASSSSTTTATTTNDNNNKVKEEEEEDAATSKRRAIQQIMKDGTLTELERRLRIQQLMDGSSSSSNSKGGKKKKATSSSDYGGLLRTTTNNAGGGGGIRSLTPGSGGGLSSFLNNTTTTGSELDNNDTNNSSNNNNNNNNDSEETTTTTTPVVACIHYERKCNVISPCCNRIFGCRVCHDEIMTHGGGGSGGGDDDEECEPMDRFAITQIVCKECNTLQGSKTNECTNCGISFAEYHCPKCNIWMALNKQPFHCDECGFCRVGGQENFRHCSECSMCISVTVYDTHNCMKDKYKNNCPVCREDMFSSRQSPQDLPCGHAIHAHCFRNLAGFDYRCPICKKTVVSQSSMSAAWQARAHDIEMQPMPSDLVRIVNIMCNDCEVKSTNRSWHFLGVQCPECSSFNTVVENVVSGNAAAQSSSSSGDG